MVQRKTQTHAEKVRAGLENQILTGELVPGMILEEGRIADQYNVSRTPIREAINQLVFASLVEKPARRRAVVCGMDTAKLLELFELLTVDGANPIEHVEVAAAAGISAAGLRILAPSHLPRDGTIVGDARAVKNIRNVCRALGVTPLDAEVMCLNAKTSHDDLDAMIATATELGFRFVQTVVEDTDSVRAAEKLAMLAEIARQAGIGVALEFMVFRPLKNLEAAVALIDRSGAENVGIVIDALHLARSGGHRRVSRQSQPTVSQWHNFAMRRSRLRQTMTLRAKRGVGDFTPAKASCGLTSCSTHCRTGCRLASKSHTHLSSTGRSQIVRSWRKRRLNVFLRSGRSGCCGVDDPRTDTFATRSKFG